MKIVRASQMKEIEKRSDLLGASYFHLMKNAGAAAAEYLLGLPYTKSGVLFLCGKGNNGGDGFVAADILVKKGIRAAVCLVLGEPKTEIAQRTYTEMHGVEIISAEAVISRLNEFSLIVDGIFGTGFSGELPENVKAIFSAVRSAALPIAALDIPSGGRADSGLYSDGTPKCIATVTFGFQKAGPALSPLKQLCGEIYVADIGLPQGSYADTEFITEADGALVSSLLPRRTPYSHKGSHGRLLNIAGSENMPGAAALSTLSALRSGVGLCVLATVKPVMRSLSSSIYEAVYCPLESDDGHISEREIPRLISEAKKSSAVSVGCGIGVSDSTKALVRALLSEYDGKIILDADGINCIGTDIDIIKNSKADIILTPHPAELSRLLGITAAEVVSDRYAAAMRLHELCGAVTVAKGSETLTVGKHSYVNTTGNAGLSRGGSGDVLTGIIGALAARGMSGEAAAVCGSFIHGRAADIAAAELSQDGMLPSDLIRYLPAVFKELIGY